MVLTSSPADIIAGLRHRGMTLEVADGRIGVSPADRLTEADRGAIRAHKPELLALLTAPLAREVADPVSVPINSGRTATAQPPSPQPVPERWAEFYSAPPFELALQDRLTWERVVALMADLDDHGVLVTAWSDQRLHVSAPEAPPLPLQRVVRDEAALIRAYVACPNCQQRHSLSPPFGWCRPCQKEAEESARGRGHVQVRVKNGRLEYGAVLCSEEGIDDGGA